MTTATETLIRAYYNRFNARDVEGFLALLAEDVAHDVNQGGREHGKKAFAAFLTRMNLCYDEQIVDLVVMIISDGSRAAAEFMVLGKYIASDEGLPPARGQHYKLPAGAFFDVKDGRISRISNFYNLEDWLKQVKA